VIRLGLIGLGYWGPNYARIVTELPDCKLVKLCDLSEEALASIAPRIPQASTTLDPDDVVDDPGVDAVIVATPTTTHHALALRALEGGKHVLCEKPLAPTVAECDDLIAAAERSKCLLFVGHTFLFNPAVRRMQQLIADGTVGPLLYAHATRTGLGPIRQDVNVLWDLAPHDVSILMSLFAEEAVAVGARGRAVLREDVEDIVFAHIVFESGAIAGLHVSWLDPYKVRRVTVVGEEHMVVFDDVAVDEKLKVFDKGASYEAVSQSARGTEFGEYRALIRDGDIHIPKVPPDEPLKEQVADFIRCCSTGDLPATDGRAGREVVSVLEAATKSLRTGGTPVTLRHNATTQ